jgi:nucleotide-binding universal stress UspA family protein
MTYKTLVVLLDNEDSAPVLANTAIAIADSHNAHIIGLHGETVDPLPLYSPFDVPDPTLMTAVYEAAASKRKFLEEVYNRTIGQSAIPSDWRSYRGTSGTTASAMIETARCADLVVSAQPRPGYPSEFNDLLFDSGRPVLFIPWIASEHKPFGRVLVAWDGSREAARAVFDALPFLKSASEVEILSVDPRDTRTQSATMVGSDLAKTLDRHDVNATVTTLASNGLSIASVIENRVTDIAADLVVMGAYSHSRLRETVFGGVTRSILESMTAATLMSR